MSFKQFVLLLFSCLLYSQDDKPYLILISFDGFRYDYTNKTITKNFDFLAENGVKAKSFIPVFPSKTFTNHYSIITGLYSQNHGIISNNFYDRKFKDYYSAKDPEDVTNPKWYRGIPIWELIERSGIKTASFYWIGSETKINGLQPTYFYHYSHYYPNKERIDQVIDWLNMEPTKRPHFITLYFSILDDAGHTYGPDADETVQAIQQADSYLGYLLKRINELPIADKINMIVVADHGMTATPDSNAIMLRSLMDFKSSQIIEDKPFQMFYFDDKKVEDQIYTKFKTVDHMTVYRKSEIPNHFHFQDKDRTPDLLFLADDHFSVCYTPSKLSKGNHGYSPDVQNMHAIFYAYGPAFKKDLRIESFENIHIYPLITRIFNLQYTHKIDGELGILLPILKTDSFQKTNDN